MMVDGLTKTCTIIPIHDDIEALKKFILEELSPKSMSEKDTRKNKFNFILTGYPSFLHNVLKDEEVRNTIRNADKSKVTISAISGGEKLSFAQRKNMNELGIDHVISSYGASDVGIGGQDKEREPAIEKACYENRDFCKELFGQDYPPSIFYYDPGTYDIHLVKENANDKMGELFYTVLKSDKAMTVMKYSMGDIGCFYKPD
jgi:phenylacetate-coenzyme A ligase PaaK-like adenylate-forming protein